MQRIAKIQLQNTDRRKVSKMLLKPAHIQCQIIFCLDAITSSITNCSVSQRHFLRGIERVLCLIRIAHQFAVISDFKDAELRY